MSIFNLNSDVSRSAKLEEDDVLHTKIALNNQGYYDVPDSYGLTPYSDERVFEGMKKYQKDNGLKTDAIMRPGGKTETALNKSLEQVQQKSEGWQEPQKKKCPPGMQNSLRSICIPFTRICYYYYECVHNPIPSGTR